MLEIPYPAAVLNLFSSLRGNLRLLPSEWGALYRLVSAATGGAGDLNWVAEPGESESESTAIASIAVRRHRQQPWFDRVAIHVELFTRWLQGVSPS